MHGNNGFYLGLTTTTRGVNYQQGTGGNWTTVVLVQRQLRTRGGRCVRWQRENRKDSILVVGEWTMKVRTMTEKM